MKKHIPLVLIGSLAAVMTSCGSSSSTVISYIEDYDFEKAYNYYVEKVNNSEKQNEIDSQIESAMNSVYNSVTSKYSSGDISASDVSYIQKLASEASFYSSSEYNDFLYNISLIDSSTSAYESGLSEFSNENYISAISYFEMVDAVDSAHYGDALDKISECETLLATQQTESIQTLIRDGKYQDALREINSLSYTYSTIADSLRSELEDTVTADIDTRVDNYFESFDYNGAYNYLNGLYNDFGFESISKKLNGLEDDFVSYSLASAENDASEKNYEAASAVVLQAMNSIGDDNETLNNAYNEYRSHLPIYITEMDCMAIRGDLTINETLEDNVGNTYHSSYSINGSGYSSKDKTYQYWADYYINGKYTTFSGTVALNPRYKDSDETKYFEIYGDGTLLYTSPTVTNTFVPEQFSIDVSGIKVLRIYYTDAGGNNRIATIYDGLLQPVTE